ncbi:MAG: amino acid ABC transporter ATP-binding protein [Propionibacteriaceae bacterium]|jgi:cystine transport system ATP-binding protein|nr:amino acid ABC transporter ATP-binding protein [Propionibacteriaceae bacterium]
MALVEVLGLRKSFGENEVLKGIDLSVEEGSVTVLIGASGSGKTTLLRCLNNLETPSSGTIEVDGLRLDFDGTPAKPALRELRSKSGFVFQAHNLFPHRTVLGNVTEALVYVQRKPKEQAEAEGLELLDRVGLADKARDYPHQLSGGQQQRVGIARALALKPKLLLFDEPTSALDPEIVGDVLQVMRDLAKDGWTMIVVTHEMTFATHVSDHVAFLDGGVIEEEGPPSQVLANPVKPRTRQFLKRVLDPLGENDG